jgi:hypothetical protein
MARLLQNYSVYILNAFAVNCHPKWDEAAQFRDEAARLTPLLCSLNEQNRRHFFANSLIIRFLYRKSRRSPRSRPDCDLRPGVTRAKDAQNDVHPNSF